MGQKIKEDNISCAILHIVFLVNLLSFIMLSLLMKQQYASFSGMGSRPNKGCFMEKFIGSERIQPRDLQAGAPRSLPLINLLAEKALQFSSIYVILRPSHLWYLTLEYRAGHLDQIQKSYHILTMPSCKSMKPYHNDII